jgi:UDP-MurNAc hydroxylase
MPFAGSYVIGGRQWRKNRYLGTTTWDEAATCLGERAPATRPLTLCEGMTFDVTRDEIVEGTYRPSDTAAVERYIRDELSGRLYPYEVGPQPSDLLDTLRRDLPAARTALWRRQERHGFFSPTTVAIDLGDEAFTFAMDDPSSAFMPASRDPGEPFLRCRLDPRLLARILRREQNWNNAEIGCHIDFVRRPGTYEPDLHTLLAFMQTPVDAGRAA